MAQNVQAWQVWNTRFLDAAAQWMRARVNRLAIAREMHPGQSEAPADGDAAKLSAKQSARRADADTEYAKAGSELKKIETDMKANVGAPAFLYLASRFGLTGFERQILLLALTSELISDFDNLCAKAQGDNARPFPTLHLALCLLKFEKTPNPPDELLSLSEDGRLRQGMLIEVKQPSGTPLLHAILRIDERILKYVQGARQLDARFEMFGSMSRLAAETTPPAEQTRIVNNLVERLGHHAGTESPIIHLLGPDAGTKLRIAQQTARALKLQSFFRLAIEQLPTAVHEVDHLARLWNRETRLFTIALYLDADDDVGLGAGREGSASDRAALRTAALVRLTAHLQGAVFLSSRDAGPRFQRTRLSVEVASLSPGEQATLWADALEFDREHSGRLAAQFNLSEDTIAEIAKELRQTAGIEKMSATKRFNLVWDQCRARTRPRIDGLAQRIQTAAVKEDLVLSDAADGLLDELIAQVDNRWRVYDDWQLRAKLSRGLAISALFVGESGTGKTTAAEVLANRLRLDLFRIDLSAVINKYIGETEKNLRRVFDAFENSGAVLFFDECDALFGKRTDVKDSHDRYANIEVSYLLQRLESYRGLAILATNRRGAIDAAFLRRLRFVITFPVPDLGQRKKIWQRVLPPRAEPPRQPPTRELDYDWLAKFDKLTGGNIQSAAIHAAFLAAQRHHNAIDMEDARDAIKAEYSKLNQSLRAAELDLPVARPAAVNEFPVTRSFIA